MVVLHVGTNVGIGKLYKSLKKNKKRYVASGVLLQIRIGKEWQSQAIRINEDLCVFMDGMGISFGIKTYLCILCLKQNGQNKASSVIWQLFLHIFLLIFVYN